MRRAVVALTGLGLALLAAGNAASAAPYPPDEPVLEVGSSTVAPGAEFSLTLQGCAPGETVDFSVEGSTDTATCEAAVAAGAAFGEGLRLQVETGAATGTLTAPTVPGTYVVTATGRTSGVTATTTIVVVAPDDDDDAGSLPDTGSSTTPPLQVGAVLVLAGAATVGVAMFRRRAART